MTDRLPPHSPEAEQGVLGCILLNPTLCLPECITTMTGGSDAFFDLRHRVLYEQFLAMWDDREPIDTITVFARLQARGLVDQVGGLEYIAALPNSAPSEHHLSHYVSILDEKRVGRAILVICGATAERVWTAESKDELISRLERDVSTLRHVSSDVVLVTKDLTVEVIDELEEAHERKGAMVGVPTGFPDLDEILGGLKPGELILVAGRPGTGKSSLAMNIAEHNAVENKVPVGVFTLEMTGKALIRRTLSSLTRLDSKKLMRGRFCEGDFPKLTNAAVKVAAAPVHFVEKTGMTIREITALARRMVQQHGIKLFIVDYLQLVRADRKSSNRYEEITYVSNGLKDMAKDLLLPVIALAQIGRDVEKNDREPRLSDLKDSGSLEQDADVVLFLHRGECETAGPAIPVQGILAKHRNGPTGVVPFTFFRQFTRYESAAKPEREPMPDYDKD